MPIAKKRVRALWICGVALLIMVVAVVFAREYRHVIAEEIGSWKHDTLADCAVVLTGGTGRVREGFDLLSRGQVRKLIISGVNSGSQLREIMPLWTFYGDLNEKDIVLDRRSLTTYGNAQQTLPLVEALQCRDVAIVTSNWHMYRAYQTFFAAYPHNIGLYKHAVSAGRGEGSFLEISTEVLKSLFYSVWAY